MDRETRPGNLCLSQNPIQSAGEKKIMDRRKSDEEWSVKSIT